MTDRQQLIVNNVDTVRQLILDAERWIWAHPQTGYTEWQAHDYLVEKYEALGYTLVKAGNIPGFYTDVETGKPGPKVAIFGELDALDIANHPESVNGMTHCCGHNAQSAALLGIAAALKQPHALDGLCVDPSRRCTGRGNDPAGLPRGAPPERDHKIQRRQDRVHVPRSPGRCRYGNDGPRNDKGNRCQ